MRRVHNRDFRVSDTEIAARHASLQELLPLYRQLADRFTVYDNADAKSRYALRD